MVAQPTAVIRVIAVTDDAGALIAPEWLARTLPVHQQLRQLPEDVAGYEKNCMRFSPAVAACALPRAANRCWAWRCGAYSRTRTTA